MSKLRIAQVAPLAESVPPKFYGGTERVVSWLTEDLVSQGHDVTLFASGDSATRGRLIPVIPKALRLGRPRLDPMAASCLLLDAIAEHAQQFDIIHCHTDWIQLPLLQRLGIAHLTTLHGRLDLGGLKQIAHRFPDACFVSISDHQREPLAEANWLGTVYHGMPADLYEPSFEPGSYLAFLGRLAPEKGPEAAIRLAHNAGIPLHIAAKLPRSESRYFKERLKPLIDRHHIHFTGELDEQGKNEFLKQAECLLFPIDWPEPFGLVMIEAMACGTPVVAYRRGSVPEVLEDGVTGFIVEDEEQAGAAIERARQLDRRKVRAAFERRFTSNQMMENYLLLYRSLLASSPAGRQETKLARAAS